MTTLTIELHEHTPNVFRSDDDEIMFMLPPHGLNHGVDRVPRRIEFRGPHPQATQGVQGPMTGNLYGHPHSPARSTDNSTDNGPYMGHVLDLDPGDAITLELTKADGTVLTVSARIGSLDTLSGTLTHA